MINKDALRHLTSTGCKNIDVAKMFNVGRHLVARFIKFHGLTDVIRESEVHNEIMQMCLEVHKFYNNFGYCCAASHLRAKVTKAKQAKLWLTLKKLSTLNPFTWL